MSVQSAVQQGSEQLLASWVLLTVIWLAPAARSRSAGAYSRYPASLRPLGGRFAEPLPPGVTEIGEIREFEVLERTGHFPMLEDPVGFNAKLSAFAAATLGRTGRRSA